MKKKILIVLFVLAISLCLAFACSASEYDFIASYDFQTTFEINEYGGYWIEEIKYLKDGETLTLTMFVIGGAGPALQYAETVYSIQPYGFKKFVDAFTDKNGDATFSDFLTSVFIYEEKCRELGVPLNSFYFDWIRGQAQNPSGFLTQDYFNKLYYYNDELTYSEGYAQGITDFTNSTAYQDTLALEKETGQAEGKDMFMASAEYKAALQKEYDNGYDKALLVSEQKQATNIVGIALGSCGIGLLVLLAVYFVSARKKHKKR